MFSVIKLFLIIMILYTFFNFYMDFRNAMNGDKFLEGNQNMKPEICKNPPGAPNQGKHGKTGCDGARLWSPPHNFSSSYCAGTASNLNQAQKDFYSTCCEYKDGKCAPLEFTTNTQPAPVSSPIDTTGRCGPLFNEQKCQPGNYCNEKNGWCGTTDAHKNAQASTKYDGEPTNKIDIDEAAIVAKNDSEVHNLTKNIFDKFNIPYNDGLSTIHVEEMIRILDDKNLPKEQIKIFTSLMMKMLDINKNSKIDFNELLVMFFGMKNSDYSEFKKTEKAFSNTNNTNNNNNNNNNNNYNTLANGNIVISPTGSCPNGCTMPTHDHPECENTLVNGKSYRQCPWTNFDKNIDCGKCGAVLLPKNNFGYARTRVGYSDLAGLEIIAKKIERKRLESKNEIRGMATKSEFFNIGKEFLRQHGDLKGYKVPSNITVKEYTLLGKVLFIYLSNKTEKNKKTLKTYIDSLYLEHYLNKKCDDCEGNLTKSMEQETKFTLEELKKRDAYAYTEGVIEAANDNRLGGSRTQYENKTAYRSNYKPEDPRKFPNPYNSMWDIL